MAVSLKRRAFCGLKSRPNMIGDCYILVWGDLKLWPISI